MPRNSNASETRPPDFEDDLFDVRGWYEGPEDSPSGTAAWGTIAGCAFRFSTSLDTWRLELNPFRAGTPESLDAELLQFSEYHGGWDGEVESLSLAEVERIIHRVAEETRRNRSSSQA